MASNNINFRFWKMAWEYKWVSMEDFRIVVITEESPFGDITPEEFKEITGEDF